jgi:hypothetical protein
MDIDSKVQAAIAEWDAARYYGGKVQKIAALHVLIVRLVKKQDRDTRHACAEAVIALSTESNVIDADAAHSGCMNAKGIK